MANEFDYRLISSIPDSYARGQEQAFQQAMRPLDMQNEFVRQRINQIRLKEAENEFATKMGRQQAAKQFFQTAQPAQTAVPMQTGAAPSYTGNAFADNMYGNQIETRAAVPEKRDYAGYQMNRMAAGDIAGAQEVKPTQGGIADKDIVGIIKDLGADKFKALKPMLAKLNPNFALIDENSLSISQDGEVAFPVLTPDGKPTGKAVIYGKDGNKQIVDVSDKSGKQVDKTIDLGDRVEVIYADGTREVKRKGITPGADIQDRRLALMEEKEAKKDAEIATKENLRLKGAMAKADNVINKVDEALGKVGFWTTGLTGDLRSTLVGRVTGGGAYDLDKTIDTIKSTLAFEELQAMRDASKTGGALGQVAVRELELLQSTIANLDKGQDEDVLRRNLNQVKTHYENVRSTLAKIAESPAAQQKAAPATNNPSQREWMDAAKKKNPAYSEAELIQIYHQKYKGKK
jgi:hypothetical protein